MTDPLTPAEKGYYADLMDVAVLIADHLRTENPEWKLQFALKVFDKIATPLHYLREAGVPAMEDVTPEPSRAVHGGEATTFQRAKDGREYAREDYVKADLLPVLQYLRVHPQDAKVHEGRAYTLSTYNAQDYLWRKPAPTQGRAVSPNVKEAGDP